MNLQILLDFLGLESIDSRVALEKLHWRSCIGEVAFGVGAESMAAGKPHSVVAPTSSASISLQMESESAPPPELADLA